MGHCQAGKMALWLKVFAANLVCEFCLYRDSFCSLYPDFLMQHPTNKIYTRIHICDKPGHGALALSERQCHWCYLSTTQKKFLFTFKVATIHRNKKQTENQETVNIRGHGNEVDEED